MLKKSLLLGFLFLITLLVVFEVGAYQEKFGVIDYLNILFCNTESYPLYGRTVWNLLNLFYFIIILIFGITMISQNVSISSKGIRSMEVLRYENGSKYLLRFMKKNAMLSLQYFGLVVISIIASIILFDGSSILSEPLFQIRLTAAVWIMLVAYIVKILFIFSLISLWLAYLILEHKYEFLLVISIVLVSILLFFDLMLGLSLVTLTYSISALAYPVCYLGLYVISFVFIKKKYSEKELW